MGQPITYNFGQIADVSTAIGTYQGTMDRELGELYQAFTQLFAAGLVRLGRPGVRRGAGEVEPGRRRRSKRRSPGSA